MVGGDWFKMNLYIGGALVFGLFYGIFILKFGIDTASIIMGAMFVFLGVAGGFFGFIPNPFKKKK